MLYLLPPGGDKGLRCTLHDWRPEGEPYDVLPDNLDQAPDAVNPPDEAISDYHLDLRRT